MGAILRQAPSGCTKTDRGTAHAHRIRNFVIAIASTADPFIMDALAALGLAANICQFVGFAVNLVNGTSQIYASTSGASEHVQSLQTLYERLRGLNNGLSSYPSTRGTSTSQHSAALGELAGTCREDCGQLLQITSRLSVKTTGKARLWECFGKAMLEVWKKDDIDRLRKRIAASQQAMSLLLCAVSRYVPTQPPWGSIHLSALTFM